MIGWIGVLAIVVIVGLGLLGGWRGLRREILVTLAGVVPGALLGYFWNQDWGRELPDDQRGLLLLASLFFATVVLGYGSAVLLRRHRPAAWERAAGAGVGLLNGILLSAFALRYVQAYIYGNSAESPVRTSLLGSALMDFLPWLFAALVVLLFIAVVTVALVRLSRFIQDLVREPALEAPPLPEREPAPSAEASGVAAGPAARDEVTVPCPHCGKPVPFGAAYCPQCGKIIA